MNPGKRKRIKFKASADDALNHKKGSIKSSHNLRVTMLNHLLKGGSANSLVDNHTKHRDREGIGPLMITSNKEGVKSILVRIIEHLKTSEIDSRERRTMIELVEKRLNELKPETAEERKTKRKKAKEVPGAKEKATEIINAGNFVGAVKKRKPFFILVLAEVLKDAEIFKTYDGGRLLKEYPNMIKNAHLKPVTNNHDALRGTLRTIANKIHYKEVELANHLYKLSDNIKKR